MGRAGVMNNTKWDELRLAMYGLGSDSPKWRTRDFESGYICPWDGEWFYHFRVGGYATIDWCEIRVDSEKQRELVLDALKRIHVPGEATENGYRVFGYAPGDRSVDYL